MTLLIMFHESCHGLSYTKPMVGETIKHYSCGGLTLVHFRIKFFVLQFKTIRKGSLKIYAKFISFGRLCIVVSYKYYIIVSLNILKVHFIKTVQGTP